MQDNDASAEIEGRHALCRIDEIGETDCAEFRIGEGDWPLRLFVVRDGENLSAFRNVCPHAGMPLNWKPDAFLTKDRSAIICSSHGAMFDKKTGVCVAGPCPGRRLKKYEVEVDESGQIVVVVE